MFNVSDLKLTVLDKPRYDRLIVLPLLKATKSEILLMDENREQPMHGIVLAVGPGGIAPETGKPVTVYAKVGELVQFGRYAGLATDLAGEKSGVPAFILRDCEVLTYRDEFEIEMHDEDPRRVHLKGLTCEHCPQQKSALIEEERARLKAERDAKEAEKQAEQPISTS